MRIYFVAALFAVCLSGLAQEPFLKQSKQVPPHLEWNREIVATFDAVLIATSHGAVNYQELADWAPCIVDTRNAMATLQTKPDQVWKA